MSANQPSKSLQQETTLSSASVSTGCALVDHFILPRFFFIPGSRFKGSCKLRGSPGYAILIVSPIVSSSSLLEFAFSLLDYEFSREHVLFRLTS